MDLPAWTGTGNPFAMNKKIVKNGIWAGTGLLAVAIVVMGIFLFRAGTKKFLYGHFHIECAASAAEIFCVKVETSGSLCVIAVV